jgi:hypothetical protein
VAYTSGSSNPVREVSISADPYEAERQAFLEKAVDLRAIAAETESVAVQKVYLLLADSYEKLAGPLARRSKSDPEDLSAASAPPSAPTR